jgi:hypothetical protein
MDSEIAENKDYIITFNPFRYNGLAERKQITILSYSEIAENKDYIITFSV